MLEARIATLRPITDNVETAIDRVSEGEGVFIIDGHEYDFSKAVGGSVSYVETNRIIFTSRNQAADQPEE